MNDKELEQAIEHQCDELIFIHFDDFDEITLDGRFTCQEIVAIAELLKKEGRV